MVGDVLDSYIFTDCNYIARRRHSVIDRFSIICADVMIKRIIIMNFL